MSLLSSIVTAGKQFVQRMSLAAWSQAWQRGDDLIDGGGAGSLVNPYAHSVYVQRAIKCVVEPISAVDLEFYEETAAGEVEVKAPLLAQFWKAPGIDRSGPMGRADFVMATGGWWKLAGEFFWVLGDEWLLPRSTKGPIIIARPDRMRPLLEDGRLAGWEFTDADNKKHALLREQVIHKKAWNPYNDLRGLAEWESVKMAAQSDYAAGRFALNMNAANGDRGVIVVAKNGAPSPEQQAQITMALREKANAAKRGSFRPIFLTGDVAIEDPKVSAPDANFIASRLENRHEIALGFGVPPSMFDVAGSYSEGAQSDRYRLLVDTCIPLAAKIEDAIEELALRLTGRAVAACFDFDDHDVMQAARRQRLAAIPTLWNVGVSLQEINDALNLGLKPQAGWEKSYIPFSVSEVGAAEPLPANDLPLDEEPAPATDDTIALMIRLVEETPDAIENMKRVLEIEAPRPALRITGEHICRFPTAAELVTKASDTKRAKLWKAHMRARRPAVNRYKAKFTKVLMTARAEVLTNIASKGTSLERQHPAADRSDDGRQDAAPPTTRAAAADFLFDQAKFGERLVAEMRKAAQETLREAGEQLFAEIGKDDPFTMPPAEVERFLNARTQRLADVPADVTRRIREALQDGIDAGDSTADLAERVKAEFKELEDGRAETIAQTEASSAYGSARQMAMDDAGIEWKEWLTSGLDTVRATHLEAEGQRVPINDQFSVGAAKLFFPGDPQGPPQEVINCHCVSIAVADSGEAQS